MADAFDDLEADIAHSLRRARFQAVVSDLLDAHDLGAPAGQLVDMLMDAAPLLAPPSMARRDWTSPRKRKAQGDD